MEKNKYSIIWVQVCVVFFIFLGAVGGRQGWSAQGGLPGTGDLNFNPAGDSENNDCLANELFGVSEQVIGPPFCATPPFSGHFVANSGEFIIAASRWIANVEGGSEDFPLTYPEGYVPNGSPAEDALSKISVKLILDHRKVYDYVGTNITKVIDAVGIPGLIQVTFLPKLPPQKVGMHTVDVIWTSVEEVCDGIGLNPDENCFATGEEGFPVFTYSFEVVSGASQAKTEGN